MIIVLGSLHSWMRLVKRSNTEVSGASGVTQFCGKLIFQEAVFLLKNRPRSILIRVLSTSDNYVVRMHDFLKVL